MKNTKPPLEKSIVNSIIKYLNSLPYCRAIKVSGDAKRSENLILTAYTGDRHTKSKSNALEQSNQAAESDTGQVGSSWGHHRSGNIC